MAPRGAPSPGRRLPPISPTPSPACPARLRRGALRRVRRTRGPAWRLLAVGPRLPLSRRPQDDGEPQFSLCQAGRAAAGPRRVPSLAKGARSSEPRAFLPPGLLLRLPPAPPRRSFRKASGRSAAASGPGVGPSAARGQRVRRGRPRARDGRGGGREGGRSVAGRRAVRTAASPGPPRPVHRPRRPRPERPHPPAPPAGAQAGTTVALLGAQPRPAPALAGGPSPPNSPWLLSSLHRGRRPLIPAPRASRGLSADPRPYLLTRVWAARRAALCPRPRPWRADGRREPGSRAERCAGPGSRPGDRGAAGSLQCARGK